MNDFAIFFNQLSILVYPNFFVTDERGFICGIKKVRSTMNGLIA